MKRSIFFIIIAVLNGIMGAFLILSPATAGAGFGMEISQHTITLLRSVGTLIFSVAVLNFLVRNEPDSSTLRSILIFNLLGGGFGVFFGLLDAFQGITELSKVGPGLIIPLFSALGSLYYLMKMKKAA